MAENTDLPVMPAWGARSFWLTIVAAACQIAVIFHFDPLAYFGFADQGAAVDAIMQVVVLVSAVWAWFERKAPNFRLSLSGKKDTPNV